MNTLRLKAEEYRKLAIKYEELADLEENKEVNYRFNRESKMSKIFHYLQIMGPTARKEIIDNLGIPKGTVDAFIHRHKNKIIKVNGKFSVRENV